MNSAFKLADKLRSIRSAIQEALNRLEQVIDNSVEVSNDTVDRVEEILEICLLQYFYEPYYFFKVHIKKFHRICKFLTEKKSLDNFLIDEINVQTRLWKSSALLKIR